MPRRHAAKRPSWPKTKRLSQQQRDFIFAMKQKKARGHAKITNREIAQVCDVATSTVTRLKTIHPTSVRRQAPEHDMNLIRKRREAIAEHLQRIGPTASVRDVVREWNSSIEPPIPCLSGIRLTHSTTRRDLKAMGYRALARPKHPKMTAKDPENRVRFCQNIMLNRIPPEFIIFSDEKWFDINDNGTRLQWVTCRDELVPRNFGGRYVPKVLVWGAIGVGWRRLVFFPLGETCTSETYLERCILPIRDQLTAPGAIFQQDLARPQTAAATRAAFVEQGIVDASAQPRPEPHRELVGDPSDEGERLRATRS